MKIFSYVGNGMVAVVAAYNRGHAARQIADYLEDKGKLLHKSHPITELKVDEVKRGKVFVLTEEAE